MTIKIPKKNIFDKILNMLGKERKIVISRDVKETYDRFGPYVQQKVKKESFVKALFKNVE
jgi:hypothetical protein